MIKNIVFDMGNVLVKYDPEYFLKDYSDFEKELFYTEIYHSDNWRKLDRGELSEEELISLVSSHIPERYHADAKKLIKWYELSTEIEGMEQLIQQLKKTGYAVYLLSNTSQAFYEFSKNISILKHFNGRFISADYGLLKPDREIFHLFCKKFSLCSSECVFIDDTPINVKSALEEGFAGIVFTGNVPMLKNELADLGIIPDCVMNESDE